MRHIPANSHSNATDSQNAISTWATWGSSNRLGNAAEKDKLHMGIAFYGYKRDASGNTLWSTPSGFDTGPGGYTNNPRVPFRNGGETCANPGVRCK